MFFGGNQATFWESKMGKCERHKEEAHVPRESVAANNCDVR